MSETMNVPVVALAGNLTVETIDGQRMLVIGPLAVAVPLSADTEAWLLEKIGNPASSIVVARPGDMPR